VPSALLYIVLVIVAFYLIAGAARYIRQEWRGFKRKLFALIRGGGQ
jgi:hypothetical protein